MQRLDAPVHHLGKAGELGHVAHREAGLARAPWPCRRSRPARRRAGQALRANSTRPGLVGDRKQRAADRQRGRARGSSWRRRPCGGPFGCERDGCGVAARERKSSVAGARSGARSRLLRIVHYVRARQLPVDFRHLGRLEGEHDLAAAARPAEPGEEDRFLDRGRDFVAGQHPAVGAAARTAPAGPRSSGTARRRDAGGSGSSPDRGRCRARPLRRRAGSGRRRRGCCRPTTATARARDRAESARHSRRGWR